MGFEIYIERSAGAEVTERISATPATQFTRYDACKLVNGDLARCGATDKASHIYSALETLPSVLRPSTFDLSDATLEQRALTIPIQGRDLILKSPMNSTNIPLLNQPCNTNSTNTSVLVTFTGSTGDFTGGTLYSVDYQQQRRITNDVVSGGVHTFTIDEPFLSGTTPVSLTAGNTVSAVPVAKGSTGVKFKTGVAITGDCQYLDLSVAGKTGGNNKIEGVDFAGGFVLSSAPYLS